MDLLHGFAEDFFLVGYVNGGNIGSGALVGVVGAWRIGHLAISEIPLYGNWGRSTI